MYSAYSGRLCSMVFSSIATPDTRSSRKLISIGDRIVHQAPAAAAEALADTKPAVSGNQKTINSPIVGTFYRKPSPDADPFTEVGSVVDKGGVVCLVEAMKMFNEIEAEYKCKIVEILKEDAEPVEFGDPLFIVEPL